MSTMYSQLLAEPTTLMDGCYDSAFRLTPEQIAAIQLAGARKRFNEMRPKLSVLDKLAKEQGIDGIDSIDSIDDVAPLLFAHTVYKSYPMSYLDRCQFDKLTRWLGGLTTEDLSTVDAKGITLIDDWVDLLDAKTNVRLFHTSGTTGRLSFMPRNVADWRRNIRLSAQRIRDWRGPNSGPDMMKNHRPLIAPSYRRGASAAARGGSFQVEMLAGGEDNALFMYPDMRFSADVASLAGRLRAAEAQGEQGALQIPPSLLAKKDELARIERERPNQLRKFFAEASSRFAGQDIYLGCVWPILYDCAVDGLAHGARQVFGPGSVLQSGGGKKGRAMPDNWRDIVIDFLGFTNFYEFYGCSELLGFSMACEHGYYHVPPTTIPFLLDPKTGKPLPRKDGTTGRYASLDLLNTSYWGGLVTGDEITLHGFERPCACGRGGVYMENNIRRYSEKEGGDDKLLCSGAPEAHDKAMSFLAELSE